MPEDDRLPARILRDLLGLQAETASADFKAGFDASSRAKGELVKCIMAFANSRDGGYIAFGVAESEGRFVPRGLTEQEVLALDTTKVADLASRYCSVLPQFTVHRVEMDGLHLVLIAVSEIDIGPVVCERNLQDENRMVLRRGAIYTRTQSAKCDEISSAEEVTDIVHRAAAKYAGGVTRALADLMARGPFTPSAESPDVRETSPYEEELLSAREFFEENALLEPGWHVEVRPTDYQANRMQRVAELRSLRSDAVVALRGWDFPHADREEQPFENGLQSSTSWESHHEGHRMYYSGLFVWRGRYVEDFPDLGGRSQPNGIAFLSMIWSMLEFMLFSARYSHDLVPDESSLVTVEASGLSDRFLFSDLPEVHLQTLPRTAAQAFHRSVEITGRELELTWQAIATDWTEQLFGLFDLEVSPRVIHSWQTRLLERRF